MNFYCDISQWLCLLKWSDWSFILFFFFTFGNHSPLFWGLCCLDLALGQRKILSAKLSCVKLLFGNVIYQKNCDCREQLTSYTVFQCYDEESEKQYVTNVYKWSKSYFCCCFRFLSIHSISIHNTNVCLFIITFFF